MTRHNPVTAQSTLLTVILAALSGCGGQTPPDTNAPPPGNLQTGDTTSLQIAATAGGYGATPGDPANKYTYVNLDSGQVMDLADADAPRNGAWHIAFKRTSIKLNGGVSGPGAVAGAVADAQDDFYDALTGEPDTAAFINASAASELPAFEAVTSSDGLSFTEDRFVPYIKGDGSDAGWWLYSGAPGYTVSANPDQWWLVRSAGGDSYAKFHVTGIVQSSRDITLELFVQPAGADAFATTATSWSAAIGAEGGSRCFDIDTTAGVDCVTAATDWDIRVEVAGRAWNIWINGGVSGSGLGGAFGPFDSATAADYLSGTTSPGGTDISRMYGQDSAGGTFSKDQANTWYAYGLQGNSKLWPNYRVYALDTGTGFYKLQILSYYDQAGVSGNYTLRYAPIAGKATTRRSAFRSANGQ